MANYYGKGRTNYFNIKPEHEADFDDLILHIESDEDGISIVTNREGQIAIIGVINAYQPNPNDEEDTEDVSVFWEKLQPLLDKDAVVIYKEVGFEKSRYLVDFTMFITPTAMETFNSEMWVRKMAKKHNVGYYTQPTY